MHCSFFLFLTPTSARNLATLHYASKVAQNCHKPKQNANLKRKTKKIYPLIFSYCHILSLGFVSSSANTPSCFVYSFVSFVFKCFLTAYHNTCHGLFLADTFTPFFSWTKRCWTEQFALLVFFVCNLKHRVNNGYLFSVCFFNNNHMFFCSVNIISWFTWVSLFNNVCFCSVSSSCLSRFTFCLFSVSWHERVLLSSLSRTMCECVCVARYQWCGCVALFV